MSEERIYQYALRLLARRDYSPVELRTKLERRDQTGGVTSGEADEWARRAIVDRVMQRLIELELVSAERFTESFIAYKRAAGFGPRRIASQLMSKGVSEAHINSALDFDDPVWLEQAVQLLQKKVAQLCSSKLDRVELASNSEHEASKLAEGVSKNRVKLVRFLANKGYDQQQIWQALEAFR